MPFYQVIIVAHTGHTWGLYTLLTELPTYMKTVLNFDIKQVADKYLQLYLYNL